MDTTNMGRGEEIVAIIHNLDAHFPEYTHINGAMYNTLHEKALQTPSELTKEELLQIVIAELKEVTINTGERLYDDPSEFLMNTTEPFTGLTEADAEKLLSDAEATGWHLPPWVTAEDLVEIYKDMEPIEEE